MKTEKENSEKQEKEPPKNKKRKRWIDLKPLIMNA